MQSVRNKILARIRGQGKGYAFSSKDFLDIGNRNLIDQSLSRLCKQGYIRRVVTGIYDFPREEIELGGTISPDTHQVAKAIARKNGLLIQPSGAAAANLLGLSTQVPARIQYLTSGKSRTIKVGDRMLIFKRVGPRELKPGSEIGTLVTQSLRFLGKDQINENTISFLKRKLSLNDRKKLLKYARYMEDWIWETVRKIASDKETGNE